jgi:tetratricopeptide (TPR) repeat protein
MRKSPVLIFLFLTLFSFSQKKGREWFLLDSINENAFSQQDRFLLDSILPLYHNTKVDSVKLRQLIFLANTLGDEQLWTRYNKLAFYLAEKGGREKVFLTYKCSALSNIGFELTTLKGDNKGALKIFEENLKLQTELGDSLGLPATMNNIAVIYLNWGNIKEAISLQEQALAIRKLKKDKLGIGTSMMHLGEIYRKQGDLKNAVNNFSKALEIFENLREQRDQADVLVSLAQLFSNQGDQEKAMDYFKKARVIFNIIGEKQATARVINLMGRAYESKKEYDKAKVQYTLAQRMYEQLNDENGLGTTFLYQGSLYAEVGAGDSALARLLLAEKYLKGIGNKQDLTNVYNVMSEVHYAKRDMKNAEFYSERAFSIAKEFGFPSLMKNPAHMLYQLYKASGRSAKALEMHELFVSMKDSLNRMDNKKAIMRQQFKYEYDKKAVADSIHQTERLVVEKTRYEAEMSKQRVVINSVIAGFLLMLVIAVISYRAFRHKKQTAKELAMQKQIIEEKQREIIASIVYAKRIQSAHLPSDWMIDGQMKRLKETGRKKLLENLKVNLKKAS